MTNEELGAVIAEGIQIAVDKQLSSLHAYISEVSQRVERVKSKLRQLDMAFEIINEQSKRIRRLEDQLGNVAGQMSDMRGE